MYQVQPEWCSVSLAPSVHKHMRSSYACRYLVCSSTGYPMQRNGLQCMVCRLVLSMTSQCMLGCLCLSYYGLNYGLNSIRYQSASFWNLMVSKFPKEKFNDQSKYSCKKVLSKHLIDGYSNQTIQIYHSNINKQLQSLKIRSQCRHSLLCKLSTQLTNAIRTCLYSTHVDSFLQNMHTNILQ